MYPKSTVALWIGLLVFCCGRIWAAEDDVRIFFPAVSINGQPVRFALDTGCGNSVLYETTAKRLGLKVSPQPIPEENLYFHSALNGLSEPIQLKVESQVFTTQLNVFDWKAYGGVAASLVLPEEGLIGWLEVRNNILVFDAEQRTVTVVDKLPTDTTNWLKLPIVPAFDDIFDSPLCLQITLSNGEKGVVEVDTGCPGGVNLAPLEWQKWRADHPLVPISDGKYVAMDVGEVSTKEARVDKVSLGQIKLTDVLLDESDQAAKIIPHFVGTMGMAALRRMDLVVDGKGGFAYIRPKLTPDTVKVNGNVPAFQAQSAPQRLLMSGGSIFGSNNLDVAQYLLPNIPRNDTGPVDLTKPPKSALSGDVQQITDSKTPNRTIAQNWEIVGDLIFSSDYLMLNEAMAKLLTGETDGALVDINQVLAQAPSNASAYSLLGMAKIRQKDFTGAISSLNRAVELEPQNAYFICGLAMTKSEFGDIAGAFLDFNQALELNPGYGLAYNGRGYLKQQQNDLDGAVSDFNQAIDSDPKNLMFFINRGIAKSEKGDMPGAMVDFDQAIEIDPKNATAYLDRGDVKRKAGNFASAILDFNHAIELDAKASLAYLGRGMAKDAQGDRKGAAEDYSKTIELDPQNNMAYFSRASCRGSQDDTDGALADINKAIALGITDYHAFYMRGHILQLKGDYSGTVADFTKLVQLHPKVDYERFFLALNLRRLKQDEAPAGLVDAVKGWKDGWTKTVGRFLIGEITEADFLAEAAKGQGQELTGHQCEANYYVGMTYLLKNDTVAARDYFTKSVATGERNYEEYQLSRVELAHLSNLAVPGDSSKAP